MDASNHKFTFSSACWLELILLALGTVLVIVLRVPVKELLAWKFLWIPVSLAATIPLVGLLAWLMKTSFHPVVEIRSILDELIKPLLSQLSVTQLLILAILAGVAEEFFFRAFLQHWLSGLLGQVAAIIIASLIFGACHLVTWFYGVFATAMGLYLGILMVYSGSVWPPVIVHALYDFLAFILILKVRQNR